MKGVMKKKINQVKMKVGVVQIKKKAVMRKVQMMINLKNLMIMKLKKKKLRILNRIQSKTTSQSSMLLMAIKMKSSRYNLKIKLLTSEEVIIMNI